MDLPIVLQASKAAHDEALVSLVHYDIDTTALTRLMTYVEYMAFLMSFLHLWTYKLTSARLLRFLSLKCKAGPSIDYSLFRISSLKKLMQSFLT